MRSPKRASSLRFLQPVERGPGRMRLHEGLQPVEARFARKTPQRNPFERRLDDPIFRGRRRGIALRELHRICKKRSPGQSRSGHGLAAKANPARAARSCGASPVSGLAAGPSLAARSLFAEKLRRFGLVLRGERRQGGRQGQGCGAILARTRQKQARAVRRSIPP